MRESNVLKIEGPTSRTHFAASGETSAPWAALLPISIRSTNPDATEIGKNSLPKRDLTILLKGLLYVTILFCSAILNNLFSISIRNPTKLKFGSISAICLRTKKGSSALHSIVLSVISSGFTSSISFPNSPILSVAAFTSLNSILTPPGNSSVLRNGIIHGRAAIISNDIKITSIPKLGLKICNIARKIAPPLTNFANLCTSIFRLSHPN